MYVLCGKKGDMRTANTKSINSDITTGGEGEIVFIQTSRIDGENVPTTHFAGVKRSRLVSYIVGALCYCVGKMMRRIEGAVASGLCFDLNIVLEQ